MFGDDAILVKIVIALVSLIFGGTITIGGLRIDNSLGTWLKDRVVSPAYLLERSSRLRSYHANTVVYVLKKGGEINRAELLGLSGQANLFFGKETDSHELVGSDSKHLSETLKQWMDKDNYDTFLGDQARLFSEYARGGVVHAEVPVIFNNQHPNYPNQSFLPVIVHLSNPDQQKDATGQNLEIAYLNIEQIAPVVKKYTPE